MQLINHLEAALSREESYFRQHLLKEDIARMHKLQSLVETSGTRGEFVKNGLAIGWTQNDMTTHQIRPALEEFLGALYDHEAPEKPPSTGDSLRQAWDLFCEERMTKLIRCL